MTASFAGGQVITVFRSRVRADADPSYEALDDTLRTRAESLGGLVDVKSFVAEDGERVTLVTFVDRASHERWATDPVHRDAQRLGRTSIYETYSIQVAECSRASEFAR